MTEGSTLNVSLCSITSLPFLIENETIPGLRDAFSFDSEVKSRWISYDPYQVTLLSCNEMFQPIYALPSIHNPTAEQTLNVSTKEDLEQLREMFTKPIFLCVTRRQEDEEAGTGFDVDFVVSLDPSRDPVIAGELAKLTDFIARKMQHRQRFYLEIDLVEELNEVSQLNLKTKHVVWLNGAFSITNYCEPNPLMYIDVLYLWFLLFPFYIFISLPYRIWRSIRSDDKTISPQVNFSLHSDDSVPLLLHLFNASSSEIPPPGRYSTCHTLYGYEPCPATELNSLLLLTTDDQYNGNVMTSQT